MSNTRVSKRMSYVLRHNPASVGLTLSTEGWVNLNELAAALKVPSAVVVEVIEKDSKNRFAFNQATQEVRANQGHSINIDLGLSPATPPAALFHGTVERNMESIFSTGLLKQSRQHVHLSATVQTAVTVASRYGEPVILTVNTGAMLKEGFVFFQALNGVWLTNEVPARFLTVSTA